MTGTIEAEGLAWTGWGGLLVRILYCTCCATAARAKPVGTAVRTSYANLRGPGRGGGRDSDGDWGDGDGGRCGGQRGAGRGNLLVMVVAARLTLPSAS